MAGVGTIHDGWRSCLKCSRWVAALLLACAVATGCTLTTDVCDNADCDAEQECFAVDGAAVCLTPCAADDDCQDDGDPCTMTVCESDTRADQGMFCATAPVDCGAELCDAETGACVECIENDDCTTPKSCVDHACITPCTVDADCDDGLVCNGTESCDSATGCVSGTALDCNDGLDCTDDACAEPDGCTNTSTCDDELDCTDDVCTDQSTCESVSTCPAELPICATGGCVECTEDADCDDGLGCNGEETCTNTVCMAGNPPCDPCTESCDESEEGPLCVAVPIETFDFTLDQDNLMGTECDDLFDAPFTLSPIPEFYPTLQSGDFADGRGGVDSLNATFNPHSPTTVVPTLLNIESINLTNFGIASLTLSGSNFTGVTDVTSADSTNDVIVDDLTSIANGHLDGLGYNPAELQLGFQPSVTTGNSDEIELTITNTIDAQFEIVTGANGFETINITSFGDETNTLSSVVQTIGTTLATVTVVGEQDLQIGSLPNTITTCDASGMTGGLTVTLAGTSSEGTTITGGIGDDDLTGSAQADVIEGGAGADTLTGGDGTDVFVYTVETDSLNTVLDTVTDFISGSDKFDVPNPPTNAGDGSAGADLTHVTVTSTGQTAATLAQDLAAVADGAGANEWDQPGDTHVVKLRGASLGGMDAVYLVIEDGTLPTTYDATEDLVLLVSDRRDVTLSISDFQ